MTTGPLNGLHVVPANEASWADLQAIFGSRGVPYRCQCQWLKLADGESRSLTVEERAERLREQTGCGDGQSRPTSGLVGYLDGQPAGWCAVEPRSAYGRLPNLRALWQGRDEDLSDDSIWAVTCFVVRIGFRRRGLSAALAAATVEHARMRGATAVEGYPMITQPGERVSGGELFVGSRTVFAAAGFVEVARPGKRRAVMRLEL